MFNIKSDLNLNHNDNSADVKQKIREAIETEHLNNPTPPQPKKKKTKAQLQKELKEKEEEDLKNKSLRTIYIDLMKAFHPDTETDEDKKLEKEEISKRITEAYNKSDLFTLLSIEIDYFEHNKTQDLAQNKMKAYLSMLTKQKLQLENDIWRLKNEHSGIYKNMCTKNAKPEKFLKMVEQEQLDQIESIQGQLVDLTNFKDPVLKKIIFNHVIEETKRKQAEAMKNMLAMFSF